MNLLRSSLAITLAIVFSTSTAVVARADLNDDALAAAKRATTFLVDQVSTEGGYLWAYTSDLKNKEGEGVVKSDTVWVQPPGTPSVGEAFVALYEATGDIQFVEAALQAAGALRRGQMRSGGWQASIEFEPERSKKWAYRLNQRSSRAKDQSSLDDDKTQSALRFLIRLDDALGQKNETVHELAQYGLDGLLQKGQFSGGGFPQVWMDSRAPDDDTPAISASYPESWSRVYTGHHEYWLRYTLNDHLARDVAKVLFLADEVYGDDRYLDAAIKLGDSLIAAQMPDPQPAWAQQYNAQMQPIWARKFEPPAITTSESFSVIETLMMLYGETGDRKYLEPIPRALDYLQTCEFPDGRVARFYELQTNRPLYFNRQYELTYDDSDLPTHYGFQLGSKVESLRKKFRTISRLDQKSLKADRNRGKNVSPKEVQRIVASLDDRGAWVSDKDLRYGKRSGPVIEMEVAVKNLTALASYLANQSD